jgi:hypothetical protein
MAAQNGKLGNVRALFLGELVSLRVNDGIALCELSPRDKRHLSANGEPRHALPGRGAIGVKVAAQHKHNAVSLLLVGEG